MLQNFDFSPFLADAEDVHASFDHVEEADECLRKGFDEVCNAACTGYGEVLPDYANVF